jgi:hypothetical protein
MGYKHAREHTGNIARIGRFEESIRAFAPHNTATPEKIEDASVLHPRINKPRNSYSSSDFRLALLKFTNLDNRTVIATIK